MILPVSQYELQEALSIDGWPWFMVTQKSNYTLARAVAFLFAFFCDIPHQPDQRNGSINHGGAGSQKLEQKAMSFL